MDWSDSRSIGFLYLEPSLRHMLCASSHRENYLCIFEWFRSWSVLSGNYLQKLPEAFLGECFFGDRRKSLSSETHGHLYINYWLLSWIVSWYQVIFELIGFDVLHWQESRRQEIRLKRCFFCGYCLLKCHRSHLSWPLVWWKCRNWICLPLFILFLQTGRQNRCYELTLMSLIVFVLISLMRGSFSWLNLFSNVLTELRYRKQAYENAPSDSLSFVANSFDLNETGVAD